MLDFDGFSNSQANMVREEILDSIDDMGIEMIEHQDIKDLAMTFSCMPEATRISFGIDRVKRSIDTTHWV